MKHFVLMIFISSVVFAEINYKVYFKNCSKELDNGYFKTCYNYEYKSATASYIELRNVDDHNLKERSNFYSEYNLEIQYRTQPTDYKETGFDKGHIQSDASNDYSEDSKKSTYVMSNITLQYPNTNRRSYFTIEKRERELSMNIPGMKSLTLIKYSNETINGIRVPSEYYKIFYKNEFMECYIIKNDNIVYKIDEMKADCSYILSNYK